jgi:hypothetical protein
MIDELRHRDPLLFWIGAGMLLTLVVVTLLSISDTRLILGINPWIKPMKFLISVTIFLWTIAWFMPEVREHPAASGSSLSNPVVSGFSRINTARWTIGVTMIIEIFLVILQSGRGATSHYNISSPFDAAVFAVMGTTIGFTTVAVGLFIWLLRRDTPPQRAGYLWGIRLGIAIFMLAGLEGNVLLLNNAHTVGAPDGGPGLPFVNWSTTAGDLRIAHFFGMHALQALPLMGFFLDRAQLPARNLIVAISIVWLAVMGGLLTLALQGRPLLSL